MTSVSIEDLLQLSVPERIQLVQDLWDSVAAQPDDVPVPESQLEEIRRRSEAHRRNPDEAIPIDDALDLIERSLD